MATKNNFKGCWNNIKAPTKIITKDNKEQIVNTNYRVLINEATSDGSGNMIVSCSVLTNKLGTMVGNIVFPANGFSFAKYFVPMKLNG